MYFVGQDTDVHFSSGAQGQPKAKKADAVVGAAVAPSTDDAVVRVIVPTTATYDAFSTGSSTLLMSLPFFSQKIFEPHRSTMYVLVHC